MSIERTQNSAAAQQSTVSSAQELLFKTLSPAQRNQIMRQREAWSQAGSTAMNCLPKPEPRKPNLGEEIAKRVESAIEMARNMFQCGCSGSENKTPPSTISPDCQEPPAPAVDAGGAMSCEAICEQEVATLPFAEKVRQLLTPDSSGRVSEEELQYGIVSYQLYQKDPAIERRFQADFRSATLGGESTQTAVQTALEAAIRRGDITRGEGEWVNGLSFRAAQLDNLPDALALTGSSSGSIALDSALQTAEVALAGIQGGIVKAYSRPLGISTAEGLAQTQSAAAVNVLRGGEANGFLWKPVSESDGRLVVLLPPTLTGLVKDAGIYSSLSGSEADLLEAGRFSGDNKNGGRAHFRFSKPGSSYSNAAFVIAELKNGERVAFEIKNPAQRNE